MRTLVGLGLCLLICSAAAASFEFRSVGLRFVLPWTGLPRFLGIEATIETALALGSISFFVAADGKTLLTLSADLRVGDSSEPGGGFIRVTTGLSYLETSRRFPSLLFGGGVAWRFSPIDPFEVGCAVEFLYPIAFPAPLLTVTGEWIPW